MGDQSIPITVRDSYAGALGRDTTYETTVDYAEAPPTIDRGQPLTVTYPVATAKELNYISQIEDQLATTNTQHISDIESTFDAAILDLLPVALDADGVTLRHIDIKNKYFKSLIIKEARCLTSNESLIDHLQDHDDLTGKLGFGSIPNQSTIWRNSNQIDEGKLSSIATRLVHAVYRNGLTVPQQTKNYYNLAIYNKINFNQCTQETKNITLQNWIAEILDDVTGPLTFNRAQNKSYQIKEIFGSAALAALINGPYSAPLFGSWFFSENDIIGSHLYDLIKSLDRDTINDISNQINANILEYASDIGFFTGPKNIALDTTWITLNGEGGIRTIKNPKECESGEGWCFAAIGFTSSSSRFTLGVDFVQDKSSTINIFRRQLRDAINAGIDIGRLHVDREFYEGQAVHMCRAVAGDNFAIRIKLNKNGEPPNKVKSMDLAPGEAGIEPNVEFAGVTPPVNACGQRVPEKSNKDTELFGFLTDLSEDDAQPSSIYQTYNKRWSIENYFKQEKHQIMPRTKSPDPLVRLFMLKIGTVFFNIHVLINNSRSPKYGYCVDVPYYQVLMAIAFLTLDIEITPTIQ